MKVVESKFIILELYVDHILLAASDHGLLHYVKDYLSSNFKMTNMGEASYEIGIEIFWNRSHEILGLSQKAYINKVLKRFKMKSCTPNLIPIYKGDNFSLSQCPGNEMERKEMDNISYAFLVEILMYNHTCTRPNISFVVVCWAVINQIPYNVLESCKESFKALLT